LLRPYPGHHSNPHPEQNIHPLSRVGCSLGSPFLGNRGCFAHRGHTTTSPVSV